MGKAMKLPRSEDLPAWFLDGVVGREADGIAEGAVRGRKAISDGRAVVCVDGPTWALFSGVSRVLSTLEVFTDPLWSARPSIPFAPDYLHPKAAEDRSAQAGLVLSFGREVYVQAPYFELLVGAFGVELEWWISSPRDPIVARVRGEFVGAIAPCYPRGTNHLERFLADAEVERARRQVSNGR